VIEVERTDFIGIPVTDRAQGVEFLFPDAYDSGVCHMAFFKDPFGNSLILHHRHAPYRDGSLP
jgi:hypothetical protein